MAGSVLAATNVAKTRQKPSACLAQSRVFTYIFTILARLGAAARGRLSFFTFLNAFREKTGRAGRHLPPETHRPAALVRGPLWHCVDRRARRHRHSPRARSLDSQFPP